MSFTFIPQEQDPRVGPVLFNYVPPTPEDLYARAHPERRMLKVDAQCIFGDEKIYEHCRIARTQGYPELVKAQIPPFEGKLIIVGAGPSLAPFADELRQRTDPIMALKGAHDWLIERGITPTYAVASDPQQSRHNCFKRLNDATIYLLASQMHPDTWGYMRGRKVIVWHSENGKDHRALPGWENIPLVWGGSTTGMRALTLAYLLGFRDIDLYGLDSNSVDGVYKVDGTKVREGDHEIEVWVGEKQFTTTLSMVPQVAQLRDVLFMLPGIKVEAFGEGYLQEVLRQGKAQGWPC